MQHSFIPQDETTISTSQKRLMSILSGILLAILEAAFLLDIFYLHIYYFQVGPKTLLGGAALLYFVAPIPLSLYISRQTGSGNEGYKAGTITGCTGTLLTVLAVGVYILATGRMLPGLDAGLEPPRGDMIFFIFIIFGFLNTLGLLLSNLGAAIGSALGKIGKPNVS